MLRADLPSLEICTIGMATYGIEEREMSDPEIRMGDLSVEDYSPKIYAREQLIEGELIRIDEDGLIINVGLKTEGIVLPQEMRLLKSNDRNLLRPGDKIPVVFLSGGGRDGLVQLSYDHGQRKRSWQQASDKFAEGAIIIAKIIACIRGGAEVDYEGIRGFVPLSHLKPSSKGHPDLKFRIGDSTPLNILELDESTDRLVLSERAIWKAQKDEEKKDYIDTLEAGSVVSGVVTSIREFGAFVDLGPAEGLLPISEISWAVLNSADEAVSIGDMIDVLVLNVDRANQKITLSLKRTLPEPWETVHERYLEGQIVEGQVTRLVAFGAFVKIEEWVEGLIHISELSNRQIKNAKECVYVGQNVSVMIIAIDQPKKRMSLSYKKAYGM